MEELKISPVPKEQQPENEFKLLIKSWFFSWPQKGLLSLLNKLAISWIISFPIILTIAGGSYELRANKFNMVIISIIISNAIPILLILRQILSWKYIQSRLKSEKIEYEESGWYDGQTWEKPIRWREKDLLISQHDVNPLLNCIYNGLYIFTSISFIEILFLISINS